MKNAAAYSPARGRQATVRAGAFALLSVACLIVAGVAAWWLPRWWNGPAPVPDHAAPFTATQEMKFSAGSTLAQTVRPELDRLTAVDVVLAAESAGLPGVVELLVVEWPAGTVLRTARLPAATVPQGSAWQYRPAQPGERWRTFGFEPIEDSGGRTFRFVLRYAEGRNAGGERMATLARFPASYGRGALFVNEDRQDGTLLFRLAAAGTRGGTIERALLNLGRVQPVFPGTLIFPGALAAVCVCVAATLAAVVRR
jgi:hypothetical protein